MKDDTVVSALQVGDVVNIDKSKILGNEAFNVLRDSGYAPNTLEFTSLNEKVATVDKNTGKISLLRTGLAYIVVKDTEKGGVGYIKINVIPKNRKRTLRFPDRTDCAFPSRCRPGGVGRNRPPGCEEWTNR